MLLERKYLKPALWCAVFAGALGLALASAQIAPPLSLYGSVTDEDGPVGVGVPIEAYIGDILCGAGETELMGEGEGQITFYFLRIWSQEDRPGCGTPDAEVQVWIGEKPAPGTVPWQARAVQFDIIFGDVTPAPIPTFTPTPEATPTPPAEATSQPVAPVATSTKPAQTPAPVIRGGVTSATPGPGDSMLAGSSGDQFPLWIAVVLVLGGVGVIGGGLGYAMARTHDRDDGDDMFES